MLKVFNTGYSGIIDHNPIKDNCIKFYEGNYEISIATEDGIRSDILIYSIKSVFNSRDCNCTSQFFKTEYKKCGYVYFTNNKLIKAIRLARKLSK